VEDLTRRLVEDKLIVDTLGVWHSAFAALGLRWQVDGTTDLKVCAARKNTQNQKHSESERAAIRVARMKIRAG
jgi:hypothetical protein